MENRGRPVLNNRVKHIAGGIFFSLWLALFSISLMAEPSWDTERLNLEMSIQKRVEEAISKIVSPGQFVLVVRVEPWAQPIDTATGRPVEDQRSGFYLPGVPERQRFDGSDDNVKRLVESLKPESPIFRRFIRRINATLVLDQDLSDEVVGKVREITREMIGLDPGRGDTLNIQKTVFQRPVAPAMLVDTNITKLQKSLQSYWLIISLSLILFCITVFFLFIFGPLRGFLNRFVQVLPTLKASDGGNRYGRMGGMEMQMPPQLMGMPYGYLPQAPGGASPANFSGSLQVENPNKNVSPFGFIREDHLGNLSILLSRETPEKAAVVLGYLPPEWISRVLTKIDPALQSEIASHLATTRQLLPEQVEDIEQDLKRRLDYLVGGPDQMIAIYESLDVDAQRRMLENLKESQPELAEDLRKRTLMFEDLEKLDVGSLKAILREVDLQTLVLSLRGASQELLRKILENVPGGKAEIIREELELTDVVPGKATMDAQRKVALIARRLEKEGHIQIPQITSAIPSARFGGSLKDTIKLPSGFKFHEPVISGDSPGMVQEGEVAKKGDITDRIRKFMSRGQRFEGDATTPDINDKHKE